MASKKILSQILNDRLKPDLPSGFDISNICFKEQADFVMDKNPWVVASCSRRSGKSVACAVDLLYTASQTSDSVCLYITLTRSMAEKLVWKELLTFNQKYKFGGVPNLTKLSLTLPNKTIIYCAGCNNKKDIEKFRGLALKVVYIDEVQSFPAFINELIDDVLGPALLDHAGSLKFIGTPAPLNSGFFWDILHNSEYSTHKWTFFNNPFLAAKSNKTHQEVLDRELKRRGVNVDHPSIRREWFGEWVIDTEALVCAYSATKNDYQNLPPILTDYVIGVDIGYIDADAIAVLGWHKHDKKCYLVEEIISPKQDITDLMNDVNKLNEKYKPLKIVMDEGGLGKKIGEELRKRYTLPITAAEKSRKLEFIALMNDAFRTQTLFAKSSSRFAKDSQIIEWDYDKSTPDKMVIKHDPHSDIFDALLYAFRESLHWLSEPIKPKDNYLKNWQEIREAELYAKMELDEAKKESEEKSLDQARMFDNYDPYLSDEENAVKFYVQKRQEMKTRKAV